MFMIRYDNCKDCSVRCEHAGKDREFVCPSGVSCKVVYTQERKAKAAADFVNAIKTIAAKPENLENLEHYLSRHFPEWLAKYANDPESLAAEMRDFANMDI